MSQLTQHHQQHYQQIPPQQQHRQVASLTAAGGPPPTAVPLQPSQPGLVVSAHSTPYGNGGSRVAGSAASNSRMAAPNGGGMPAYSMPQQQQPPPQQPGMNRSHHHHGNTYQASATAGGPMTQAPPRPMGMGNWQPAQPTSMQGAAGGYPGMSARPPPYAAAAGGAQAYHHYANPYAAAPSGNPAFAGAAQGSWGGQPAAYMNPHHRPPPYFVHPGAPGAVGAAGAGAGGVFYPSNTGVSGVSGVSGGGVVAVGSAGSSVANTNSHHPTPAYVPAQRTKKPLVITDRHGNVLDLASMAPKKNSANDSNSAAANSNSQAKDITTKNNAGKNAQASKVPGAVATNAQPETLSASEAGANLRRAILERLNGPAEEAAEEQVQSEAVETAKEKEPGEPVPAEAKEEAKPPQAEPASEEPEEKVVPEMEQKVVPEVVQEPTPSAAEEEPQNEGDGKAPVTEYEKAPEEKEEPVPLQTTKLISRPGDRRIVFSKQQLLNFRDLPSCQERPSSLPDMTIVKGASRGRGGGGGGRRDGGGNRNSDGGDWKRSQQPLQRQSSRGDRDRDRSGGGSGGGEWQRGQAMPKPQQNRRSQSRGGRGGNQPPLYDGPVAPLRKSENHWKPQKNTSALVVAEKSVKSILNKMTKEKFDRLSQQMVEIPIISYEMLSMMIENIYDKAIDEPSFGDIYADLCVKLSQSVQDNKFVHIIESDEEPPTESGGTAPTSGDSSHNTVYRWSNDVGTSDSEIVGPFASADECMGAALDQETTVKPGQRGDLELELVSVSIKRGMFVKIMKKKGAEESEGKIFYTVFFPVVESEECGQQLSDIFLSQVEAISDANKKNSFKRSLLNKCENEFNKQDIYVDWKKKKEEYEAMKGTLSEAARAEQEEELGFQRIRIKKQMLGNVKFIGQLFKKNLLKEKVMRFCVATLLKLDESKDKKGKNPEYEDNGNTDMDEEDHEAICSMFTTIGSTIDTQSAAFFMNVCFTKITKLSKDKNLPARSRFMYKDLIELRAAKWVPRRKVEKAKTLDEIRKDVEAEEKRQAEISARENARNNQGGYGARGGRGGDFRSSRGPSQSNRLRQPKVVAETDDDGFTTITSGKGGRDSNRNQQSRMAQQPVAAVAPKPSAFSLLDEEPTADDGGKSKETSKPAPLSADLLERRIKSITTDFIGDGGNVKELLLSMEELSGTPDAYATFMTKSADRIMDCKENERLAINKIICIIAENKVLSFDDAKDPLSETIEFVDSFACDAPKAYEYVAELVAPLLRIGFLNLDWVVEQIMKTKADSSTTAPVRLVRGMISSLKNEGHISVAKTLFGPENQSSLSRLFSEEELRSATTELS